MIDYCCSIWRARYFWASLVLMDLQTRYRRSVLGLGWSLLQPIIMTTILYTVFHPLFMKDVGNYALFVLSGLVFWNFFTSTTILGCQCFLQAEGYIRQHPLPLAIFPLRTALGGLIHFLLALGVVLAVTAVTQGFSNPLALLSLLPGLVLLFLLAWSVGLLAGLANVLFRDTEHLVQVFFQVLFYVTPIFYPPEMLSYYRLGWLVYANPLAAFLHLVRDPILDNTVPSFSVLASCCSAIVILTAASGLALYRMQRRLIFFL